MLTKIKLLEYVSTASMAAGCEIKDLVLLQLPVYDPASMASLFTLAYAARVELDGETHISLVGYRKDATGDDVFSVWCGDKFLEGRISRDDATARATEAARGIGRSDHLSLLAKYESMKRPSEDRCNFWSGFTSSKKLCAHTQSLLAHLRDNVPDFCNHLQASYDAAVSSIGGASSTDRYTEYDLLFKVPILVEGDRGAGKTRGARDYARHHGYPCVELPGHEGVESIDILGYQVRHGDQFVWMDGPLSEAFRIAKTQKVVLLMDELRRIPIRQQTILLTALSPAVCNDGKMVYRLRTNRIVSVEDGVAKVEVLECPVENIAIWATTNVGAGYVVEESDKALEERFVKFRKDTEEKNLREYMRYWVTLKSLDLGLVDKAVSFYNKMKGAYATGQVCEAPTTRTLLRAFELADKSEDVVKGLRTQYLLWVAQTAEGLPVESQVKVVEKLLTEAMA